MKAVPILVLLCCLGALLAGCQSVYVTSAKVYLQQNDIENARLQLEEGLRANPNDAEARYLLGSIYAQQKLYPEMLREFDAALALSSKHKADMEKTQEKHFRDLYNAAVENFNNQRLDSTFMKGKTAAEKFNRQELEMAIGQLKMVAGNFTNQQLEKAVDQVKTAVENSDRQELEVAFEQLKMALGNIKNQRLEMAIEQLKTAVTISPSDREAWSLLSKSQIRIKQYAEGKATLQKAISLDPQYTSLDDRVLLMEMQYNDGQQMEALNIAEDILGKDAANKDAIRVAAFCYNYLAMQEQDVAKKAALQSKALDYYQKVLESQPEDADLLFNLGLLFEAMERYDDAIAQFERAFSLNPKDLEAFLHTAQIYLDRKNDNQKAVVFYKRALELDPDNAGIWNNLGISLIRAGEKENSEALIKEGTSALKKAEELRGKQ